MVSVNLNHWFLLLVVVVKDNLGKNVWFAVWVTLEVSLEIGAFAKTRIDSWLAVSPQKEQGEKTD